MFPLLMKYNILLIISFGREAGRGIYQFKTKHYNVIQNKQNLYSIVNVNHVKITFKIVPIIKLDQCKD